MEVAIALGLPVGFYKVNSDNLNLLQWPSKTCDKKKTEKEQVHQNNVDVVDHNSEFLNQNSKDAEDNLFPEKCNGWDDSEQSKEQLNENPPYWLENKVKERNEWDGPESEIKTLSTKFEPNLSSKLLDSSNDSIDDVKYEEPDDRLVTLDSDLKDVEQSNSSDNLEQSPNINLEKNSEILSDAVRKHGDDEDKSTLWNENSSDKISAELWNENSSREKWDRNSDLVQTKDSPGLWTNENDNIKNSNEKSGSHLWNENSNITSTVKVDETNSQFLDSLLSVPNSNEFLTNESESFLSENIQLINDKSENIKSNKGEKNSKEKNEWSMRGVWDTEKNSGWNKEESIISGGLQERMPGVRTSSRLTSTPEGNGNINFTIPSRRNSISDFSNINLESANLDIVLPSAKTLIKDCLKNDEEKFDLKKGSFLENSDNFKVKNWEGDSSKSDFSSGNVNSEDFMKIALESLTSQHDVINVPSSNFDSAIEILNPTQESGNLNLFSGGEADGLDFNLPLPDHLLRTNDFTGGNFQTTCAPSFHSSAESSNFLSNTNNIFETTNSTLTNSIKYDQYDGHYSNKKTKSLDDVMEFFDAKAPFNGYEDGSENSSMNNFSFESESTHNKMEEYNTVSGNAIEEHHNNCKAKKKTRLKKFSGMKKNHKSINKKIIKNRKMVLDYPKSNTIESIINEALFDSCASNAKTLQIQDSSPNCNRNVITNSRENYSLPIITGSLDEVDENLDFLNQD